jgi:hypothetical protein
METNKTQSENFLDEWARAYEGSEGDISEPIFSNVCEYSEIKHIPFQRFEDGSIVIVYKDWTGKVYYEHFDNDEYLDEEWDIEWSVNNNTYVMQNVWDR